jgi:hypothetical protein
MVTLNISLDTINASRYYGVVILSFACAETERVFKAKLSRHFPPDIQRRARRKLLLLHAATELRQMAVRQALGLRPSKAAGRCSTASVSTTSGGFVLAGAMAMRMKSKS